MSQSTLFFLNRNSIPPVSSLTASSRCALHRAEVELELVDLDAELGQRAVGGLLEIAPSAWSSAFDGMQPTLRQVPPSVSRLSAQAVFSPSCAARIAAT